MAWSLCRPIPTPLEGGGVAGQHGGRVTAENDIPGVSQKETCDAKQTALRWWLDGGCAALPGIRPGAGPGCACAASDRAHAHPPFRGRLAARAFRTTVRRDRRPAPETICRRAVR